MSFHLHTVYSKKWPGTESSDKSRIDFFTLNKECKKILSENEKLLIDKDFVEEDLEFFILQEDETKLFAIVHEYIFQVEKTIIEKNKRLFEWYERKAY